MDPIVKADQCAQYVDDIGIAFNNATDLTRNFRAVIKCIRQAGLKLTFEKCHVAIREDIHTTPIEVTTSSSDVADEEQIFLTHADNGKESEEQSLERKEQS